MHKLLTASSPVAVFTDGIGDHLMFLPALRALAGLIPDRLAVVCHSEFEALLLRSAGCAEVMEYRYPGDEAVAGIDLQEVPIRLRNADLLLSLNDWGNDCVEHLLAALKPRQSIGFDPYFDVELPWLADRHAVDMAFDVPRTLAPGLRAEDYAAPPEICRDWPSMARDVPLGFPDDAEVLAVHAEVESTGKRMATDLWSAVLDGYLSVDSRRYVVTIGVGEDSLRRGPYRDRIVSCHGTELEHSVAIIARADLFLGVDSAGLHIAYSFGVPGVGLFASTDPRRWGFRFAPHRHVRATPGVEGTIRPPAVIHALDELRRQIVDRQAAAVTVVERPRAVVRRGNEDIFGATCPLVLCRGGIGSAWIHLPAVRALAKLFPRGIVVRDEHRLADMLFTDLGTVNTYSVGRQTDSSERKSWREAATVERLPKCDLVVFLDPEIPREIDVLLRHLGGTAQLGIGSEFLHASDVGAQIHTARFGFEVVRLIAPDLSIDDYSQAPALPACTTEIIDGFLEPMREHRFMVVVHADCHPNRMLPSGRWDDLLTGILELCSNAVVFVVGKRSLCLDRGIFADWIISCIGLPLLRTSAMIARADLFIGVDSGPLHIADIFRVPSVGLFGTSDVLIRGSTFAPHCNCVLEAPLCTASSGDIVACIEELMSSRRTESWPKLSPARSQRLPRLVTNP